MKLFEALEAINKRYQNLEARPLKNPVIKEEFDVKNYKKQYYLNNLNTYKERNRLYRERLKEEKMLENLFCNFEE